MPLRADLRNLRDANGDLVYRGAAWKAQRERLLERCGNKCERCRKPNHETVETITGLELPDGRPWMLWRHASGWINPMGVLDRRRLREKLRPPRVIRVVLTKAHLTHNPLDNDDADQAMLCQWCQLNYDRLHHRDTRCERKDAARPILRAARDSEAYAWMKGAS